VSAAERFAGTTREPIPAPVGNWWLAYEDGTVWPCEVLAFGIMFMVEVRPVGPAPDAGQTRWVQRRNVYDAAFNRPAPVQS
jgi:hypothetical protein